ncbi:MULTISPECIES: hypothetical protein [unclassified Moritella]|uniref:hypothetical protein n=1 Tax=unclassified Moritella TaxID=2637987 RepID=UPI001BA9A046|nr:MULTISPECIES: hypothetical protein [unclassified Moritella]QUM84179.1 hypothetical protein HWV02_06355 [Moritella sp. 28]QUM88480.1 hypothetical protein HWV03_06385 [Moritella sp. 36]
MAYEVKVVEDTIFYSYITKSSQDSENDAKHDYMEYNENTGTLILNAKKIILNADEIVFKENKD